MTRLGSEGYLDRSGSSTPVVWGGGRRDADAAASTDFASTDLLPRHTGNRLRRGRVVNPTGYHDAPWPIDGGSGNRSGLGIGGGLSLNPTDHLVGSRRVIEGRPLMFVQREPGQLFLLGSGDQDPAAWVEAIDPVTLEPIARSANLAGDLLHGSSLVAHRNGDLYLAAGSALHRLGSDCQVKASVDPGGGTAFSNPMGHNLLVLDDGALAAMTVNGDGIGVVTVYDTDLQSIAIVETPEPPVAGLAAVGNAIYFCGPTRLFRLLWNGRGLDLDTGWQPLHGGIPHGSDNGPMVGPIVANGRAWVANNAFPPTATDPATLADPAKAVTEPPPWTQPIKVVGVATDDPADTAVITPTDVTEGWVMSAPLAYDNLVLAWDTGNTGLAAFELPTDADRRPVMIWYQPFRPSIPPLLYPDSGELVINDFRLLDNGDTSDDLVVLDVRTGQMKARVPTGSPFMSSGRLCPGWGRDVYYCSRQSLVRFRVESL